MAKRPNVGPILYADRRMEEFHDSGFSELLAVEEGEAVDDMGPWEDEVGIKRKEGARDGRWVVDCYAILGMAHFSPCFFVCEASTQQTSFWGGRIKFSHIASSSSCLVGICRRSPGF